MGDAEEQALRKMIDEVFRNIDQLVGMRLAPVLGRLARLEYELSELQKKAKP